MIMSTRSYTLMNFTCSEDRVTHRVPCKAGLSKLLNTGFRSRSLTYSCIRWWRELLEGRMGPPELTETEIWKAIGMRNDGMSLREIARRLSRHHSSICRLLRKHQATGDVEDRPRSGRPRCTAP